VTNVAWNMRGFPAEDPLHELAQEQLIESASLARSTLPELRKERRRAPVESGLSGGRLPTIVASASGINDG
jgi:hypothetical protein